MPLPFVKNRSGPKLVTATYIGHLEDASDVSSYSGGVWDALPMGTAGRDRKILVLVYSLMTASQPSLSSATFGGTAGVEVGAYEQNPGIGIWAWEFPNRFNTSGNLSLTFAGTVLRVGIRIWALYGAGPAIVQTNSATTGTDTTVANANVLTQPNGKTISGFISRATSALTVTWTNGTEDSTGELATDGTGTWVSSAVTSSGTATITGTASVAGNGVAILSATYGAS